MHMEENVKNPKKRRRFKFPKIRLRFAILWVFIIVMLSGFIVAQAGRYNELRTELNDINARITSYQNDVYGLQLQIEFFDNDAHIEDLARERLGMVRPNEIVFRNTVSD